MGNFRAKWVHFKTNTIEISLPTQDIDAVSLFEGDGKIYLNSGVEINLTFERIDDLEKFEKTFDNFLV